jgi:hypothetical protein
MSPFYFGVVFWGETFRSYFLDFCLASLLSPNNIPALENPGECRFLICTTRADWAAMQSHPTFGLLEKQIQPILIEMGPPSGQESKMRVMSHGHKALAEKMYEQRACGTFIYPDTVFADGVVAEFQRLAKEGKKVVLAHCPRFANEGLLEALAARGLIRPGMPIALSAKELIAMALPHMHSETRRYEWEAPYFYAESPVFVWWRVPGGGLLAHAAAWAPILVDYAEIARHDTGALNHGTIDGDYIHRNFPDPSDVHAVTDSETMTLMSFTPESSLTYLPLKRGLLTSLPLVGTWYRRLCLRAFLFSPAVDPLKRRLFVLPVTMYSSSPDPRVAQVQRTAADIITRCLYPPNKLEQRSLYWLRILNEGLRVHLGFWVKRRLPATAHFGHTENPAVLRNKHDSN